MFYKKMQIIYNEKKLKDILKEKLKDGRREQGFNYWRTSAKQ